MEPLISIVIPTISKRSELLEEAIKSVREQTHKNVEIIPVKDCINPCEARNIGIRKASGEFIAFLDDDDTWYPTKLEEQLKVFEESDQQTLLVICWINDKRFKESYIDKYEYNISRSKILNMFRLSSTSSYMFRTSFLKENEFNINYPSAQEYELAIRTVSSGPESGTVKCVQKVLVQQNKSQGSITRDWVKKRQGLRMLFHDYKHLYKMYGIINYIRFIIKYSGIIFLYSVTSIVGDRIYKIIVPLKKRSSIK